MLYIQNRYDHDGNKIEDITACRLKYEDELIEFLNEIYAGQHNESSEKMDRLKTQKSFEPASLVNKQNWKEQF